MKKTISLFALSAFSLQGATVWQPANNALAGASWDIFSFSSPTAGDSGTQGPAQATTGALLTSSELTTEMLAGYDTPPGGFLGNPDTFYLHNGGAQWTINANTSSDVTFVRVSYSLVGFGGGAPEAFPQTPEIAGGNVINSGSYATASNTVFFTDIELSGPTSQITSQFGDTLFPGYPGSFRSIDGVQLEVFDALPVPEPSALMLTVLGSLGLIRRRR